jgi:hypothetical protein
MKKIMMVFAAVVLVPVLSACPKGGTELGTGTQSDPYLYKNAGEQCVVVGAFARDEKTKALLLCGTDTDKQQTFSHWNEIR